MLQDIDLLGGMHDLWENSRGLITTYFLRLSLYCCSYQINLYHNKLHLFSGDSMGINGGWGWTLERAKGWIGDGDILPDAYNVQKTEALLLEKPLIVGWQTQSPSSSSHYAGGRGLSGVTDRFMVPNTYRFKRAMFSYPYGYERPEGGKTSPPLIFR